MSLEQLYQQIILEHSKLRTGSGLAETPVPAGASSGQSHQLNPVCGDEITVRVAVSGGKVAQLRWDGAGCSISMASASVLAELAEGMDVGNLTEVIGSFRDVLRSRGNSPRTPKSSATQLPLRASQNTPPG